MIFNTKKNSLSELLLADLKKKFNAAKLALKQMETKTFNPAEYDLITDVVVRLYIQIKILQGEIR